MPRSLYKGLSVLFVSCFLFVVSGCTHFLQAPDSLIQSGGGIQAGEWTGDTFTNSWSNITFTLPSELQSQDPNALGLTPGHTNDLYLRNDDQTAIITLMYIDQSQGAEQKMMPEDYLNIVKQQLTNSKNKNYTFPESFETAIIAGEEYVVMRTEYNFKENPTKEPNYQDGYARKLDNAMVVFLTVYGSETKDFVDTFLSSIKAAN